MRSKAMLSVLLILLAAALIGGATMAWFTDKTDLEAAEFTAGTLEISADGPNESALPDRHVDNINPGDTVTVCWDIKNIGTKRAELRAHLDTEWLTAGLSNDVYTYALPADSDWVIYEEDGKTWFKYNAGPLAGTYDGDGDTVKLCVEVVFDGPLMGNDFQGAKLEIGGEVEAVQTTNGAPEAVWGDAYVNAGGGQS